MSMGIKVKNKLRQLLCRHDYRCGDDGKVVVTYLGRPTYLVCETCIKCGKAKDLYLRALD